MCMVNDGENTDCMVKIFSMQHSLEKSLCDHISQGWIDMRREHDCGVLLSALNEEVGKFFGKSICVDTSALNGNM